MSRGYPVASKNVVKQQNQEIPFKPGTPKLLSSTADGERREGKRRGITTESEKYSKADIRLQRGAPKQADTTC